MSALPRAKLRAFFAKYTEEPEAMVHWYSALGLTFSLLTALWFLLPGRTWVGFFWLAMTVLHWYLAYVCWRKSRHVRK